MLFVQAAVQTLDEMAVEESAAEIVINQLERQMTQGERPSQGILSSSNDLQTQSYSCSSAISDSQTVLSTDLTYRCSEDYTRVFLSSERGAPPPYEEVIDPNAPPPSYDSLFGRVRDVQKTSHGMIDFFKNLIILLLGTIGCGVIVGVTVVIPISMIVIGSMYLYDCPQGEYIPIYLLVGGAFGVLKQLLHLSSKVRQREEEQEEERIRQSPTQTLLNCFMLGWFIIGSVWVYKEYEPNYDPSQGSKYCNRTLYLFAFWLITSVYIALGAMTLCLCSVSIGTFIFSRDM
uniref:Uncharacterized protein n=1 Tax=Clastoptera arizonana TaxID=38151 RepID=A0A1B6CG79_9HEMI